MKESVLTAQSQKADYYDPGGDGWETTPQISFSPATHGRTRDRMTTCVSGQRAVECLRAPGTWRSRSLLLRDCSFSFGGYCCEVVTMHRGCRPVWLRALCYSWLCLRAKWGCAAPGRVTCWRTAFTTRDEVLHLGRMGVQLVAAARRVSPHPFIRPRCARFKSTQPQRNLQAPVPKHISTSHNCVTTI